MWLFPAKLGEGKLWIPTAIVAGGTAGFIRVDPPPERKVRQTDILASTLRRLPGRLNETQRERTRLSKARRAARRSRRCKRRSRIMKDW